ncbi:MAG: hypothetical protein WCT99_03600 [Bacteroidota bacterium]|jgi:hypothetical protein
MTASHSKDFMTRKILAALVSVILFTAVDRKEEPTKPPVTEQPQDTTSHNWVFEKPVFLGDGSSSALYDVAIINDSLAYAVGEIYKKDSIGNWDPLPYNLVKWNGKVCELKRVTINFRGNMITPPLFGKFAFTPTDIWLAGGLVIHGDGAIWTPYDVRLLTGFDSLSLEKCWGVNSSQMYFAGIEGSIAHYNGSTWTKIESGTNLPFLDIYGATDSKTGEQQILALCSQNHPHERGLYQINGNTATQLSTYPLNYDLSSVWFVPNKHYYLVGSGMFEKDLLSESNWKNGEAGVVKYGLTNIRGNNVNDVIAVGSYGEVLHYNGVSWQSYIDQTGVVNGGQVRTNFITKT